MNQIQRLNEKTIRELESGLRQMEAEKMNLRSRLDEEHGHKLALQRELSELQKAAAKEKL